MFRSKDTCHYKGETDTEWSLCHFFFVELLFPQNHSTDNIMLVVTNVFIHFLLC